MIEPAVESKPGLVHVDGLPARVYNEAAFRYFLGVERRRAERTRHHLLLVLVSARKHLRTRPRLAPQAAQSVLWVLGACLREVDLVGWYRDGVVAAALLPIIGVATPNTRQALAARVTDVLKRNLPHDERALAGARHRAGSQTEEVAMSRRPHSAPSSEPGTALRRAASSAGHQLHPIARRQSRPAVSNPCLPRSSSATR